jgi:hypothetical protein
LNRYGIDSDLANENVSDEFYFRLLVQLAIDTTIGALIPGVAFADNSPSNTAAARDSLELFNSSNTLELAGFRSPGGSNLLLPGFGIVSYASADLNSGRGRGNVRNNRALPAFMGGSLSGVNSTLRQYALQQINEEGRDRDIASLAARILIGGSLSELKKMVVVGGSAEMSPGQRASAVVQPLVKELIRSRPEPPDLDAAGYTEELADSGRIPRNEVFTIANRTRNGLLGDFRLGTRENPISAFERSRVKISGSTEKIIKPLHFAALKAANEELIRPASTPLNKLSEEAREKSTSAIGLASALRNSIGGFRNLEDDAVELVKPALQVFEGLFPELNDDQLEKLNDFALNPSPANLEDVLEFDCPLVRTLYSTETQDISDADGTTQGLSLSSFYGVTHGGSADFSPLTIGRSEGIASQKGVSDLEPIDRSGEGDFTERAYVSAFNLASLDLIESAIKDGSDKAEEAVVCAIHLFVLATIFSDESLRALIIGGLGADLGQLSPIFNKYRERFSSSDLGGLGISQAFSSPVVSDSADSDDNLYSFRAILEMARQLSAGNPLLDGYSEFDQRDPEADFDPAADVNSAFPGSLQVYMRTGNGNDSVYGAPSDRDERTPEGSNLFPLAQNEPAFFGSLAPFEQVTVSSKLFSTMLLAKRCHSSKGARLWGTRDYLNPFFVARKVATRIVQNNLRRFTAPRSGDLIDHTTMCAVGIEHVSAVSAKMTYEYFRSVSSNIRPLLSSSTYSTRTLNFSLFQGLEPPDPSGPSFSQAGPTIRIDYRPVSTAFISGFYEPMKNASLEFTDEIRRGIKSSIEEANTTTRFLQQITRDYESAAAELTSLSQRIDRGELGLLSKLAGDKGGTSQFGKNLARSVSPGYLSSLQGIREFSTLVSRRQSDRFLPQNVLKNVPYETAVSLALTIKRWSVECGESIGPNNKIKAASRSRVFSLGLPNSFTVNLRKAPVDYPLPSDPLDSPTIEQNNEIEDFSFQEFRCRIYRRDERFLEPNRSLRSDRQSVAEISLPANVRVVNVTGGGRAPSSARLSGNPYSSRSESLLESLAQAEFSFDLVVFNQQTGQQISRKMFGGDEIVDAPESIRRLIVSYSIELSNSLLTGVSLDENAFASNRENFYYSIPTAALGRIKEDAKQRYNIAPEEIEALLLPPTIRAGWSSHPLRLNAESARTKRQQLVQAVLIAYSNELDAGAGFLRSISPKAFDHVFHIPIDVQDGVEFVGSVNGGKDGIRYAANQSEVGTNNALRYIFFSGRNLTGTGSSRFSTQAKYPSDLVRPPYIDSNQPDVAGFAPSPRPISENIYLYLDSSQNRDVKAQAPTSNSEANQLQLATFGIEIL